MRLGICSSSFQVPVGAKLGWRLAILVLVATFSISTPAQASQKPPNVVYFLVDNLGIGELSVYSGGPLRGTFTPSIDHFAAQGLRLTNFAPEAQCTPSRAALMTGRYAIRTGNQRGPSPVPGAESGLVAWEKTMGDVFKEAGYKTLIVGKWHLGESPGFLPTDHGFDHWYGIIASYGEATWASDPYYRGEFTKEAGECAPDEFFGPGNGELSSPDEEVGLQFCPQGQVVQEARDSRDPVSFVTYSARDENLDKQQVKYCCQLTDDVRRDIDRKYLDAAKNFITESHEADKPFFLYFNHSMMHMPNIPRLRFKGKTGHGDWADSLLELDTDFDELMKHLKAEGLEEDTIVVFSGDNGPEEYEMWEGAGGHWDGSYFTGMEGSLRTPAIIRYRPHGPNAVVPPGVSNEIVHITDMFTTLIRWAGLEVPKGRVIDGVDQRNFFEGKQTCSNRDGFPYWLGDDLYGIKWQNFKLVNVLQRGLSKPALSLPTPNIVNVDRDPKERRPFDLPILHSWITRHAAAIQFAYQTSVQCEPNVPPAPSLERLSFVPENAVPGCWREFTPKDYPVKDEAKCDAGTKPFRRPPDLSRPTRGADDG